MKESRLLGGGDCVRRLLLETALLPPPIRRRRWGRPDVTGRPCCRGGASLFWRRDGTASFIARIGVFLTVAHLVPKCLLVVCELPPKRGVSSEPCAELVPSVFCAEALAILVTRAIFHWEFWSAYGEETADSTLCGTWQPLARRSATKRLLYLLLGCSLAQSCRAPLLAWYSPCRNVCIPWQRRSWVLLPCPLPQLLPQYQLLVVQQSPLAAGAQTWAIAQLTR